MQERHGDSKAAVAFKTNLVASRM